jgi:transformation/transcription domain-associated protein
MAFVRGQDPNNYFQLMRALFRSIGGGKFEYLYKEFLPLLPALLDILGRLQFSSHPQKLRDLFVELCLTVPVRLSSLLPCLRLLMRPLVLALASSNNDLVRTPAPIAPHPRDTTRGI